MIDQGLKTKTALISVFNKQGIVEFAKELVALDFKILASGGTAKELSSAGIEVTDVASLVGGGAILGHRVVTLSREVHAGLLARDIPEDRAELEKNNIPWIDLVCVDLYPLQEEINRVISNHPAPSDGAPLLEKEGKTAPIRRITSGIKNASSGAHHSA
jgi:AICAR transformylase/IMP cyclohydrolase PurH (only IMP cyclohydrolase domain in Aful)